MAFQAGTESIVVETDANSIATLTLDRPGKKNAVTHVMWRDLARLVEEAGADGETRIVVLRGTGVDFCAGADIGEFDSVRRDAATARDYETANSRAFAAIRNCPVPTLAAISGICFGGGFGIAAACDLRIATRDAKFSVPAARLGLAYPADAMSDIVTAAGPQMARYLAYSGARIDAEEALRAGFLLSVEDDRDMLATRAMEIAAAVARSAPLSVRASKASIGAVLSRDPAREAEAKRLGDLTFDSADYAEGRAAFRERRDPRFTGR